jgi:hypothetical protein
MNRKEFRAQEAHTMVDDRQYMGGRRADLNAGRMLSNRHSGGLRVKGHPQNDDENCDMQQKLWDSHDMLMAFA